MPLSDAVLGTDLGSMQVEITRRDAMAYAAGVPDDRSELFDTTGELVVHPVFPVSPEWALLMASPTSTRGLTSDEARGGVHSAHDLVLTRPLRVGDRVRLAASVVGVSASRAGARQHALFTATDESGDVVWRTLFTSTFLGVALDGEPRSSEFDWPAELAEPNPANEVELRSPVGLVDAHVYTECARIWNPIHTDIVAARRAGLVEPILHGTATMARAVSAASRAQDRSLADVRRVTARMLGQVRLGTTLRFVVRSSSDVADVEAQTDDGVLAMRARVGFSG